VAGNSTNTFLTDRVELMIRESAKLKPSALHTQEVLLPRHLYQIFLKEKKLNDWLQGVKQMVQRELRVDAAKVNFNSDAFWKKCIDKQPDVGRKVEYLLKTGNLISQTSCRCLATPW
jgi:hypothetical protein